MFRGLAEGGQTCHNFQCTATMGMQAVATKKDVAHWNAIYTQQFKILTGNLLMTKHKKDLTTNPSAPDPMP